MVFPPNFKKFKYDKNLRTTQQVNFNIIYIIFNNNL